MYDLSWLFERFRESRDQIFMIHAGEHFNYSWLLDRIQLRTEEYSAAGIKNGTVAALRGDYSPEIVAALLSLIELGAIIVPLSPAVGGDESQFMDIAEVDAVCTFAPGADTSPVRRSLEARHPLNLELRGRGNPGLVLFSSGSTGKSKGALHDFALLLEKFKVRRRKMITLTFLMIDHIGGINTLLHVLSNTGTVVVSKSRIPDEVCATIERNRVELLPTSPTFLNLLLVSEAYSRYDLSSLGLVTYGTEMMPKRTLDRVAEMLPHVTFQQTYGLSELGILRSKSEHSNSLWVKVGGEGFQTKIQDGTLWIKAQSAMLGYYNAPSPFDEDGWMNTGDAVETQGDYVRFLGRATEIINVGGLKVYPSEVEDALLEMTNVEDVTVSGEPHPITGNVVVARFNLREPEDFGSFKRRVREFCRGKLEAFKIPARIEVVEGDQFSARFKKMRRRT
ncbi:MAG: AMP-binding protein [Acidobacteria bacterium]|nr:AMP-binding protein [Acidobacteriota bacterium]